MPSSDRRPSLWKIASIAATLASATVRAEPPDILVFLTDDQGIGQTSPYVPKELPKWTGTPRYEADPARCAEAARAAMPTLSRLASEGVRFTNAHVMSGVCAPSRTAILTGCYPQRFGIYSNNDANPGLSPAARLLPDDLRKAAYRTGAFGKWHLAKTRIQEIQPVPSRDYHDNWVVFSEKGYAPQERGFDAFFGYHLSGASLFGSPSLFRDGDRAPAEGCLVDQTVNEAITFIEATPRGQRLFAYVAFSVPHVPLDQRLPARFRSKFDTGNPETDNYYASLAAVDDGIGRVLASLEKSGRLGNTLIFFLSDHGAVVDSPYPGNAPYRGYKGQYLSGATLVPFIVWWPAKVPGGRTFAGLTSSMDILPTALDAAGRTLPEGVDGRSLLPQLSGTSERPPHDFLFWAGPRSDNWDARNISGWTQTWKYLKGEIDEKPASPLAEKFSPASWAVRSGAWVLHWTAGEGTAGLFDIARDAGELRDVAAEHPELVADFRGRLRTWLDPMPPPPRWPLAGWQALRASVGLESPESGPETPEAPAPGKERASSSGH